MNIKTDNAARLAGLKEKEYKKLFGISKTTFDTMLEVLESATLMYWRKYRTYENIAFDRR